MRRDDGIRVDKILKFPNISALRQHAKSSVTPLDSFYIYSIGSTLFGNGVSLDNEKVFLSQSDSKELYLAFLDYMTSKFKHDGSSMAMESWLRFGPTLSPHVPRGLVVLGHGYLSLIS